MRPKDIKTLADVSRWLRRHVEWNDEFSRDMMLRAVAVIADEGRCPFANYSGRGNAPRCGLPRGHDGDHKVVA